jgi:hypothetical protein
MELVQKVNNSIGAKLRTIIFDPLLKVFKDRKRLFLATDGDLSFQIGFEGHKLPEFQLKHFFSNIQELLLRLRSL